MCFIPVKQSVYWQYVNLLFLLIASYIGAETFWRFISTSSIFDKWSILQQTISPWNHTFLTKVSSNEFVPNAYLGSKKMSLQLQKKKLGCFLVLNIKNIGSGTYNVLFDRNSQQAYKVCPIIYKFWHCFKKCVKIENTVFP